MTAIRIETKIDSETLHLPQRRPPVGKDLESMVRERLMPAVTESSRDWAAVEAAALSLDGYDFQAYRTLREVEMH